MAPPFPRASPGVPPVAMALRLGAGPARAVPTRRSVRCFGEMAPPFPRAGPGVPPVVIALRLGAGPAQAVPTRRSVRRIFPAARVAGKNDLSSFRLAPETRKGFPLPGLFPEGRRTGVPGRLPASVGSASDPARRGAALAVGIFISILRILAILGRILSLRSGKIVLLTPSRRHSGGFARRRGGILKPPRYWGISPAGSSAGAVPFFPAAPEIGDKLWNRLPRRNRPSSSSRAL